MKTDIEIRWKKYGCFSIVRISIFFVEREEFMKNMFYISLYFLFSEFHRH